MKKTGFTLAEVLITLSIIGVVAAMTLPTLTANVQKTQIGPALAKAVNTLENANRMAMQQYESRNIDTVAKSIKTNGTYIDLLETQVSGAVDSTNSSRYISKDGISFLLNTTAVTGTANNKYAGSAYTITIDTNGPNKKPNADGEDLYDVLVDKGGAVIPVGGNEWKKYTSATAVVACTATSFNKSCTGAIADNGWKVPY